MVAEVKDSFACAHSVELSRRKIAEYVWRFVNELNGVDIRCLSVHSLQHIGIIISRQVRQQLMAKTSPPDREHFAIVILLFSEVQNKLGILGPFITDIDFVVSSGEQNTVDLWKELLNGLLSRIRKNGHNLSSWHLQVFNVGGCDVGSRYVLTVDGVLSVDADHWVLRRQGKGKAHGC